jgi:hypothetical protein
MLRFEAPTSGCGDFGYRDQVRPAMPMVDQTRPEQRKNAKSPKFAQFR